jgi:hypothetical protein
MSSQNIRPKIAPVNKLVNMPIPARKLLPNKNGLVDQFAVSIPGMARLARPPATKPPSYIVGVSLDIEFQVARSMAHNREKNSSI